MSRRLAAGRGATAWARLGRVIRLAWLLVALSPFAAAQTIDQLSLIETDIDPTPLVCRGGALLYVKDGQTVIYDLTDDKKQIVKAKGSIDLCQRRPNYLVSVEAGGSISDYSGRVLLLDEDLTGFFRIQGRPGLFANTLGTIRSKTPKGVSYTKIPGNIIGGILLPDKTALLVQAPGQALDLLMTARLDGTPIRPQGVDTLNLRVTAVNDIIYDTHDPDFPLKILGRTNHFRIREAQYGIQSCYILKQILYCRPETTTLRGESFPHYDRSSGLLFQYVARDSCLAVLRLDDANGTQKCVLESQFPVGVLAVTHDNKTGWKIYLAAQSRTEGSSFKTDTSLLVGQWHPAGP